MVSKKLKAKYSAGRLKQAAGKILPMFSRDNPSDLVNEILREDESIRLAIVENPKYRELLEKEIVSAFKKYKNVIRGARVIDSWDRVSSVLGLASDAAAPFTAGLSSLISAGEEVVEGIPKGIYAIYYGIKTGDWKALPKWALYEGASFIPVVGDAIDMTNVYITRARKMTKEKVKKKFRKNLGPGLEKRIA